MPKYLVVASYTAEGAKGVLKDGGSKRRQAAEAALKSVGGKVDAFYFAFGENDVYAIIDAPDNVSVAAASLTIGASGAVQYKDGRAAHAGRDRPGDQEGHQLSAARALTPSKKGAGPTPFRIRVARRGHLCRSRIPTNAE